ncbi:MAG TPA: hypothetical protein VKV96_21125 [Roseiarcus sp.]|nr:hypothetical protein [Roseiarcus sp.]
MGEPRIDASPQAFVRQRINRAPLPQRADGVAHRLVGVGIFAPCRLLLDEGVLLWRQADVAGRHGPISLIPPKDSRFDERRQSWDFENFSVDSELICTVLVAHQLSASSAFVLLWDCGQRVCVVHISTGAPPSGFRRRFCLV